MGVGLIEPGAGGGGASEVKVRLEWAGPSLEVDYVNFRTLSDSAEGSLPTGGGNSLVSILAPDVTYDLTQSSGWKFPAAPGVLQFTYLAVFADAFAADTMRMLVDVADETYSGAGYAPFMAVPFGGNFLLTGTIVVPPTWQEVVRFCPYIQQLDEQAGPMLMTAFSFNAVWTPLG